MCMDEWKVSEVFLEGDKTVSSGINCLCKASPLQRQGQCHGDSSTLCCGPPVFSHIWLGSQFTVPDEIILPLLGTPLMRLTSKDTKQYEDKKAQGTQTFNFRLPNRQYI